MSLQFCYLFQWLWAPLSFTSAWPNPPPWPLQPRVSSFERFFVLWGWFSSRLTSLFACLLLQGFCDLKCGVRCANAGVKDRCLTYCGICCRQCNCVPSGTYGNKSECPCYRDKLNSKGMPKCPWSLWSLYLTFLKQFLHHLCRDLRTLFANFCWFYVSPFLASREFYSETKDKLIKCHPKDA